MSGTAAFDTAFAACPLIAILRGVRPDEVVATGQLLRDAGFRLVEVPLNSPDPFDSIARLVKSIGDTTVIGAGTVMQSDEVQELQRIGCQMVLSPHFDPVVVEATVAVRMTSVPGVMSPTEAFGALRSGAHALKLFPMEIIGAGGVKAMRAVLPRTARLIAVGGVDETNMQAYHSAGCTGFGLGSTLYRPGDKPERTAKRASLFARMRFQS